MIHCTVLLTSISVGSWCCVVKKKITKKKKKILQFLKSTPILINQSLNDLRLNQRWSSR